MMGVLYVAGERPRSGATSVVLALASTWRRAGRKVALAKPVSFVDDDQDAVAFAEASGSEWDAPLVAPRGVVDDVLAEAGSRVEAKGADADVVIVEGLPYADAAGEPTPGSAALAEHLGAKVLIVLPWRPPTSRAFKVPMPGPWPG
jgi:BioD-like phosphotransacetylase family protein